MAERRLEDKLGLERPKSQEKQETHQYPYRKLFAIKKA